MPMRKLVLRPGVDVEETPTKNEAQISASQLIKFYAGLPSKRGGWQQMVSTPLIGRCSGLHGWGDIGGVPYLAAGTEQRLALLDGGMLVDITPVVSTQNPAVAFSTTAGSSTVTVSDPSYNPAYGDWINLQTQVAVGGLVLFGYYIVTGVVDSTHYTIAAASNATANVTNGGAVPAYTTTNTLATVSVGLANHGFLAGDTFDAAVSTTVATVVIFGLYAVTSVTNVNNFVITASSLAASSTTASENGGNARIQYLLPSGATIDEWTGGYGLGDYGGGDYGLANTSVLIPMREWSLDNFGQDLIASPTGGAIYYWQPSIIQPASLISNTAPVKNQAVFVMSQSQMVIALGSEFGGIQQPLLVRWCDAGDFTDWTATVFNQAGSYTIPQGSRLVGGLATGLGALLWTDVGLYQMTYQGLPFVFGFRPIATGCGLIGMRAFAVCGSLLMWWSNHGPFLMDLSGGSPQPLECSVWDILFNNWDLTSGGAFVMGANTLTNEFELFFPLAQTSSYYVQGSCEYGSIKYNYIEKVWDYSITPQLQRTAWQGHWVQGSGNIGNPVGSDIAGLLQQHEIGYDANGVGMEWFWQTGDFDISEGEEMVFVDWIIPDFVGVNNPTINMEVVVLAYPNAPPVTVGPFTVTDTTVFVPPFGARGRQAAIRCSGNDLGTFSRLGAVRLRFAPDGRGI